MTKIIKIIILIVISLNITSASYAVQIDFSAIEQIESSGNPRAFNRASGASGAFQITDICRRDFNQITGASIARDDLFDRETSRRIAEWYITKRIPQLLKARGKEVTTENVLISYNAGFQKVGKPLCKKTRDYIDKYKRLIKKG